MTMNLRRYNYWVYVTAGILCLVLSLFSQFDGDLRYGTFFAAWSATMFAIALHYK